MKFFTIVSCVIAVIGVSSYADELGDRSPDIDAKIGVNVTVENISCFNDEAKFLVCNNYVMNESEHSDEFIIFGFTVLDLSPATLPPRDIESATSTSEFLNIKNDSAATSTSMISKKPARNLEFSPATEQPIGKNACVDITLMSPNKDRIFQCGDTISLQGGTKTERDFVINFLLPK